MRVQKSELEQYTWWEYQAMLWNYNERQDPDGEREAAEAPDADRVANSHARIVARGLAHTVH